MTRFAVALLVAGLCRGAQPPESSVATVVAMVRTAIRQKQADSRLARDLHKVRLGQSLDDHTIEELESEGAGPKAVTELLTLRDLSEGLPAPTALPDFPAPPLPLRAEQDQALAAAREHALNYTRLLPDFICSQTVRRYEDFENRGSWKLKDVLTVRLTYFEQREDYKLVAVNNRATTRDFESVGGAVSEGEFGSVLASIFDPRSGAQFRWDHWTHLRHRVASVFYYRILKEHSAYSVVFGLGSRRYETVAGEHGFVYVDRDSGEVLRISRRAELPKGFPVVRASTLLDYDFVDVAGRRFLLPLHADVRMYSDYVLSRNEVEFSGYRKFSGESTITFEGEKQ